jgi:hypothetical protein
MLFRSIRNWIHLIFVLLFAILSTAACAQEREEDDDGAAQTEIKDKDAAKRERKAERKTRKAKKDGKSASKAVKLLPPSAAPSEFEFFEGAIFSRKVNLGMKGVLCFASERRPLAMLWKEAGQGEGAPANSLPIKLSSRELQLIFGRTVDVTHVSVLNENGQMMSRGAAAQVTLNLGRKPIYLLVEISPSRPKVPAVSVKE